MLVELERLATTKASKIIMALDTFGQRVNNARRYLARVTQQELRD